MKNRIPARRRTWSDEELVEWQLAHPIGTVVRYWPIRGVDDEYRDAEIRSEVWRLGHGAPVVQITGTSGGVSLDHLSKISQRDAGSP